MTGAEIPDPPGSPRIADPDSSLAALRLIRSRLEQPPGRFTLTLSSPDAMMPFIGALADHAAALAMLVWYRDGDSREEASRKALEQVDKMIEDVTLQGLSNDGHSAQD